MSGLILPPSLNINQAIFNSNIRDMERTPILLGKPRGMIDTITKQYPQQTSLYHQLRQQDWTENEFSFEMCLVEFETLGKTDPAIARDMIRTIAWQWETDSTIANTMISILSAFISSSEIFVGYQRIADNESIHGLTYAKIVEMSFADPIKATAEILADKEALNRLTVVAKVFEDAAIAAHRWSLFQLDPKRFPLTPAEQYQIYDTAFLYIVAILLMERIQFAASFAVTFGICNMGYFVPIGDAVQKIAQDEMEIHVPFGAAVIRDIMSTERGMEAYKNNLDTIVTMNNEVVGQEVNWVDVMHSDGHENVGFTSQDLKDWVYFGGAYTAIRLGIQEKVNFPIIMENPLPYMAKRFNLDAVQPSPMEAPGTAYMVNAIANDDNNRTFDTEGLF